MSIALLMALPALISSGIATVQEIKTLIQTFNPGMTDAEANAILELVKTDAKRRSDLAASDQRPNG